MAKAYCKKINFKHLIAGYSRIHNKSKHVPTNVAEVILYYYPKMNGSKFTWTITDKDILNQIINQELDNTSLSPTSGRGRGRGRYRDKHPQQQNKEISFDSDTFDIGIDSKFFLKLRPYSFIDKNTPKYMQHVAEVRTSSGRGRGYRSQSRRNQLSTANRGSTNDYFVLSLMAFPLTKMYQYVIFHSEFNCHQMNSAQLSTIYKLDQYDASSNNDYGDDQKTDYNNENNYISFDWIICKTKKIQKLKTLSFTVCINVLKIQFNQNANHAQPDMSPLGYNVSVYSYQWINYSKSNKLKFSWNLYHLDRRYLYDYNKEYCDVQYIYSDDQHNLPNSPSIEYKYIYSDIFYGLFQLQCHGVNKYSFQICGLPKNTDRMGIKLELYVNADNKENKKIHIMSKIVTVSYDHSTYYFTKDTNHTIYNLLLDYKKVLLFGSVTIIQKYDKSNMVINDIKKIDTKDNKYHNEEINNDNENDENDNKLFSSQIRNKILLSNNKIIKLQKETFFWHIDHKNELFHKLKRFINAKAAKPSNNNRYSQYDDRDDYYQPDLQQLIQFKTKINSDIFQLCGNTFFITISNVDPDDMIRGYGGGRRYNGNEVCQNCIAIYLNWIGSENHARYGPRCSIHCKVKLDLIEINQHTEYYQKFGEVPTYHPYGTHNINIYSCLLIPNKLILNDLNHFTLKVDVSLIDNHDNDDNDDNMYMYGAPPPSSWYRRSKKIKEKKDQKPSKYNEEFKKVESFLYDIVNLPQYFDLFISHGIDNIGTVKLLTMDNLNQMGIIKVGHQINILHQIDILKQQQQTKTISSTK